MAAISKDIGSNAADASLNVGLALRDVADDLASIKVASPAALTAGAPASLTSATVATANAADQSSSYVEADVDSIATLANALKTSYNALRVDFVDLRTKYIALLADVTALRAQQSTTNGTSLKTTKA